MFGIGKKKENEEVDIVESKDTGVTYDGSENVTATVTAIPTATITDDKDTSEDEPAPLTWKEAKALKRSRYEEKAAKNDKYTKMYIIRNKRTNQIVELRAASSLHAANIIGWKPRKIEVLDVREIENPSQEPETAGSSASASA